MSNVQEALKNTLVMLDALTVEFGITGLEPLIAECKSALSEIEKCEPVGYLIASQDGVRVFFDSPVSFKNHTITPVYTSPISKEWVGVSDYAINKLVDEYSDDLQTLLHQYEFLLKQLNTKG